MKQAFLLNATQFAPVSASAYQDDRELKGEETTAVEKANRLQSVELKYVFG